MTGILIPMNLSSGEIGQYNIQLITFLFTAKHVNSDFARKNNVIILNSVMAQKLETFRFIAREEYMHTILTTSKFADEEREQQHWKVVG